MAVEGSEPTKAQPAGPARGPAPESRRVSIPEAVKLAWTHHKEGRPKRAANLCRAVLRNQPDNVEALQLLGVLAYQAGNVQASIRITERALAINPRLASCLSNLCEMYRSIGSMEKAVEAGKRALEAKADYPQALNNLGIVYYDLKRHEEAISCFRQAIALNAGFAEAYNNLGNSLRALHRVAEATTAYGRAIQLRPRYSEAFANLGLLRREQNALRDAQACFERAIECNPDNANAHTCLGMLHLLYGNQAIGWVEYEWRLKLPNVRPRNLPGLEWGGEDLTGKTLVVYREQGAGDNLQFCRYLNQLRQRAGRLVLAVEGALVPLMAENFPGVEVVSNFRGLERADYHCALLGVMPRLGLDLDPADGMVPYLKASGEAQARWAGRFKGSKRRKVGIVWAGNPKHLNDHNRSVALGQFAPILALKGIDFYSLQAGPRAADIAATPSASQLADLSTELTDWLETAAVIEHLDLVIAVDTSVAHLAGAMNRPVWLLLPKVPDWRWALEQHTTPWYPSMRLFRQKMVGQWDEVFERVREALAQPKR